MIILEKETCFFHSLLVIAVKTACCGHVYRKARMKAACQKVVIVRELYAVSNDTVHDSFAS